MQIKVKKFDEISCRHRTIGLFYLNPDTTVQNLKDCVSTEISVLPTHFHFETHILGTKIFLSESFPLYFYFPEDSIKVLFIEIHHKSIKNRLELAFDEALESVKIGDQERLKDLFSLSSRIKNEILEGHTQTGWSLLHFASISGNDAILQILLNNSMNVNEETHDNWTPLMLACAHCHNYCARRLLNVKGIQINKVTKRGSALHLAVLMGHVEIVELLLTREASIDLEDLNGKIPLEVAQDPEIIEMIPKFQGNLQLLKYTKDRPAQFASNVTLYSSFFLSEKTLFLFINLEKGFLEEHINKQAFINKDAPKFLIKIVEIENVAAVKSSSWSFRQIFYFEIVTKNIKRIYYTEHLEMRDEWVTHIGKAVQYCQLHRIGVDNSNKDLFTIVDEISDGSLSIEVVDKEKVSLDSFERLTEIGSGSFGTVYKVLKKSTGAVYAMKCLSKFFLNKKKMLNYAISEIKIMEELNNPFILKLHYSFDTQTSLYLILEYCEKGDLESKLDKGRISELEAKFCIAEVILGLEYLHSQGIIYRDLKPANILIDSTGHIKLADFGLARAFDEKEESISTVVGSPAYISPEIIMKERLSKAVDLYSLGIVIHELLSGSLPFDELGIDKLFYNIKNSKFNLDEGIGSEAKDLIKRLLSRKPQKRPSFTEIKTHAFFKGIDWELLASKRYMPPHQNPENKE